MELLSPVNSNTLDAALQSGADAVYFGMRRLNARRGASNFSQEELAEVVRKIHEKGAKAHLAINIDLSPRETGLAARMLQFAQECNVDAVIVRDPAILALREFFPGLEFHLSTQSGVSTSEGVRMARELGCDRVVLARELTREEIRACCQVEGIAIEVFVQGAMCFCASGRCLLSSWVGGRSGNRGACASPCRVGWKLDKPDAREGHPLSMKDLCLLGELDELEGMGVQSLKIEGRLKSAKWVSQAVGLYRRALAHADASEKLVQEAASLGGYTGRTLTRGYYEGNFDNLTDDEQGRIASRAQAAAPCTASTEPLTEDSSATDGLEIHISEDPQGGTLLECALGRLSEIVRIPPQRIAKAKRAEALGELVEAALERIPTGMEANCVWKDDSLKEKLMPRRCDEMILQGLAAFLKRATKEDDGNVRTALPRNVSDALALSAPSPENRRTLGTEPDLVRVRLEQLPRIPKDSPILKKRLVVEFPAGTSAAALAKALDSLPEWCAGRAIVALPPVCYEKELDSIRELLALARQRGLDVEANSWDTLHLVREAEAGFVTGQGLAVLNPLAARLLHRLGAKWVAVSCEIDRRQLEELTASSEVPLSICVYSRPPLMRTRAHLPRDYSSNTFHDARMTRLKATVDASVSTLRPASPFDWRGLRNASVKSAHAEIDLAAEDSPEIPAPAKSPFLFNYDRTLR